MRGKEKKIMTLNFFLPHKLVIGDQFKEMDIRYLSSMHVNSRHSACCKSRPIKTTGNLHVVTIYSFIAYYEMTLNLASAMAIH